MSPVRILHAHSTFGRGGKELRAVRLMNAFGAAPGHEVITASPGELGAREALAPVIRDIPTTRRRWPGGRGCSGCRATCGASTSS